MGIQHETLWVNPQYYCVALLKWTYSRSVRASSSLKLKKAAVWSIPHRTYLLTTYLHGSLLSPSERIADDLPPTHNREPYDTHY